MALFFVGQWTYKQWLDAAHTIIIKERDTGVVNMQQVKRLITVMERRERNATTDEREHMKDFEFEQMNQVSSAYNRLVRIRDGFTTSF